MSVQAWIQTDRSTKKAVQTPLKNLPPLIPQYNENQERQKQRKIKKLTLQNRQLIKTLKQQNEQLSKIIQKQKTKGGYRSASVSIKQTVNKQGQSVKRQLNNVYKQIDMYKSVLHTMRAKQISIQSQEKISQLQNRVKLEDLAIQNLQKQLKTKKNLAEQQLKELKIFQSDQIKKSIADMEDQIIKLKEKVKEGKKTIQKRQEIQKKQQNYQIQLQKHLRMINNEYYPGKIDKKQDKVQSEIYRQIKNKEWQMAKTQFVNAKKTHQENVKRTDATNRQKLKQLKSFEENTIKIRQKLRFYQNLKNKVNELSKLTGENKRIVEKPAIEININQHQIIDKSVEKKQKKSQKKQTPMKKKIQEINRQQQVREVKKWMIPTGYYLQKGKVMPDSIFFTDKAVLATSRKTKIIGVRVWTNLQNTPNIVQFLYQNQTKAIIQGVLPIDNMPTNLLQKTWQLNDGDYLAKLSGRFLNNLLVSITLKSKLGNQVTYENQLNDDGVSFLFEPRPHEIPSGFFGAYVIQKQSYLICYIGCQFVPDW